MHIQLKNCYIPSTFRTSKKLLCQFCMVLRIIFRSKKNERSEQFMILHNEKLCDLYRSPIILRTVKFSRLLWAGKVARITNTYRILVGKSLLGRWRRWEDETSSGLCSKVTAMFDFQVVLPQF